MRKENDTWIHKIRGCIPNTKDSDGLLTKKKGIGVLDLDLMVLPLTVNTVVLEHVGLSTATKVNVSGKGI